MITVNDIIKECMDLKFSLKIIPLDDESELYSVKNEMIVVSQDWIENLEIDDNAFHILLTIGECCFYDYDDDIDECYAGALDYAIDKAEKYALLISSEMMHYALEKYGNSGYSFDYSNICDEEESVEESTILELVEKYGLPLKLTFPRYYGDFYFLAEKNNTSRHMIEGTQYLNGKEYREKSYSYNEICSLYITDDEEPEDNESNKDVEYNNSIKRRIKARDSFDEVESNNDELLNHQKAGLLLASKYDKFAFFYDTGTGKTVMSLSIIKEKQDKEDARFLIIAPKAIIKSAWLEDQKDFFPDLKIFPLSNNISLKDIYELYCLWVENKSISPTKQIKAAWKDALADIDFYSDDFEELFDRKYAAIDTVKKYMEENADHYLINIEKFRYDPDAIMDNYEVNGLIFDESAILKNPSSKTSQTMFTYADDFDYIYLLSGKPAPNNSTEYYAQMRLVDPNTFNMSFNNFKSRFFVGSGSKTQLISDNAEQKVAQMIAVRSLIVSKEDCLDLPEMFHETKQFDLPSNIMEQYNKLLKKSVFELKEKDKKKTYYSTACKLAVFTKLRQVASGFLIDAYGSVNKLHDKKLEELKKIIEENRESQIIIWCQFKEEIKDVENALSEYGRVVTAYGGTKNIDQSIKQLKNGEAKYIVAHPKSIKYGVTFTKCNIAIYYSMSYSAEDYYQSRDRIHRLGQDRICTYYYIQARDTIDEVMYKAVKDKMSYADLFSMIIKHAAKHGIDYQSFVPEDAATVEDELISTQIVKQEYDFNMVDDMIFSYKYDKKTIEDFLYNTLLVDETRLRPEQVLFEIGFSIKHNEVYKDSNAKEIQYTDVREICKWVLSEMKRLKIKRIQQVYDYLEEQIYKQYEIDVANGAKEIKDINELEIVTIDKK